MAQSHDQLEEQPIPSETNCPGCGASPTEESVLRHGLSDMGYLHDDIWLECQECENRWVCGVPIGEGGYDDLWCNSCDDNYGWMHRFEPWEDRDGEDCYRLHLKCETCNIFWHVKRYPDDNGLTLVGYPPITGQQDSTVSADGYPDGTLNTDD